MTDKKINYKALGLKAGLEVHQQLDTKTKLFCRCSTAMREKEPVATIMRKQHPVTSELGEVDITSQYEYLRNRTFHYQVFRNETCLVELDEEPPHPVNQEALETAIQIALLLNCEIPNEIQIMRKTVTDGSNPSAFQRTMIVGLNGYLRYKGEKIPITQVTLEEDAAAIVNEEDGNVTYRLNRLGIPLVEIDTGLLIGFIPEEIQQIAYMIGITCKSTGKTKRGIGSIRQDVNVSVKIGERSEIKGVQELGILGKVVENEVQRQVTLSGIRNYLQKQRVRKVVGRPVDITHILRETRSKLILSVTDKGGSFFTIRLPKFAGLLKKELCTGKTLGRELADYVSTFGIKGIIHSDEDLRIYQLVEEFKEIREYLDAKEQDAIILVGEIKGKGKVSQLLIEKINRMLEGPEKETRSVNQDVTTKYSRPLPGAARLYPETDLIPVLIAKEYLEKIKKESPEPWTNRLVRFKKKLKLSDELATQILRSDYLELFEKIVKTKKIDASIVANTFVSLLKDLEKRENVNIEKLNERHFIELFDYIAKKRIVKEAIPEILKFLAIKPEENISTAVSQLDLKPLSATELIKIVKETVYSGMNFDKAVGLVMSKVRGKIDIQLVMKTVKKFI